MLTNIAIIIGVGISVSVGKKLAQQPPTKRWIEKYYEICLQTGIVLMVNIFASLSYRFPFEF